MNGATPEEDQITPAEMATQLAIIQKRIEALETTTLAQEPRLGQIVGNFIDSRRHLKHDGSPPPPGPIGRGLSLILSKLDSALFYLFGPRGRCGDPKLELAWERFKSASTALVRRLLAAGAVSAIGAGGGLALAVSIYAALQTSLQTGIMREESARHHREYLQSRMSGLRTAVLTAEPCEGPLLTCPSPAGRGPAITELLELHAQLRRAGDEEVQAGEPGWLDRALYALAGIALTPAAGADFDTVDRLSLRHGRFFGADLHGVDLEGVDLEGVDLRGANLRRANFAEANLSGADLRWADLRGASLEEARISGATFSRSFYDDQTVWPGSPPTGARRVDAVEDYCPRCCAALNAGFKIGGILAAEPISEEGGYDALELAIYAAPLDPRENFAEQTALSELSAQSLGFGSLGLLLSESYLFSDDTTTALTRWPTCRPHGTIQCDSRRRNAEMSEIQQEVATARARLARRAQELARTDNLGAFVAYNSGLVLHAYSKSNEPGYSARWLAEIHSYLDSARATSSMREGPALCRQLAARWGCDEEDDYSQFPSQCDRVQTPRW